METPYTVAFSAMESAGSAGGAKRREMQIEMQKTLGDVPELSTVSSSEPVSLDSIKEDAEEFRTKHPVLMALAILVFGLLIGGCVMYVAGFTHGVEHKNSHSTPPPPHTPTPQCNVGDSVKCPGDNGSWCAGNQCCPGGVSCPSASNSFSGCAHPKTVDCTLPPVTTPTHSIPKAPASPKSTGAPTSDRGGYTASTTGAPTAAVTTGAPTSAVTTVSNEDACEQCHKANTKFGYTCIARINKYLTGSKNDHMTKQQVYSTVANEHHHGSACAICDQCDVDKLTTSAPTAKTTSAPTATTTGAPTAAAAPTSPKAPIEAVENLSQSAFAARDCTAKNGGHPDCPCEKSKTEDFGWSFYDGYLDDQGDRPEIDYSAHPNRDIPDKVWHAKSWQTDAVYVNHFIAAGLKLTTRATDAIYEEYGHAAGSESGKAMFKTTKLDLSEKAKTLKTELKTKTKHDTHAILNQGGWTTQSSWKRLVKRILHAVLTEDTFTVVLGGHSAAAGHGNNFEQSYMMQFHQVMEPVFRRLGVKLVSRNMAMGGLGTAQSSMAGTGIYGDGIDMMLWDSSMTEGWQAPGSHDMFFRQALQAGSKVPVLWIMRGTHSYGELEPLHEQGAGIGEFGSATEGVTNTKDEKHAETLPYSMRYMKCDDNKLCNTHKFNSKCWLPRADFEPPEKQSPKTGGQASWHPGWRAHRLDGRVMAVTFLAAIEDALLEWQEKTIQGDMPLPGEYWHLTPSYEQVRANLQTYTGACEAKHGFPRLCGLPMKSKSEYTPRANIVSDGLIGAIVSAEGNYDLPVYGQPMYDGPDIPLHLTPEGEVDVPLIVDQRECIGLTDAPFYGREMSTKLEKWKGETLKIPPIRSQVKYPNAKVGDVKKNICATKSCCVNTTDLAQAMGCKEAGYEPVRDDNAGCTKKGEVFANYKCVFGGPVVTGKGWHLDDTSKSGVCDGTASQWCDRDKRNNKCLQQGSPDGRGGLSGDGFSGWLVVRLSGVKNGLILVKNEHWHNGANKNNNKQTKDWTAIDGNTDEPAWRKSSSGRRLLGGKTVPYPETSLFDVSLNGKITTMTISQWNAYQLASMPVGGLWPVLDDDSGDGGEKDYEVGVRIRNCGRDAQLYISHIYYS